MGDEGGFAPDLASNEAALEIILEAIEKAGYKAGKDIYLGLDVASSEFFKDGQYDLEAENRTLHRGRVHPLPGRSGRALSDHHHRGRHERGRLGRLGDPDRARSASKIQLVGDDLFVTNTKILAEGIAKRIANAILIKPNQIGTLTETLAAIDMADQAQLRLGGLAPLGRDRGLHHRRHRGGHRRHADQDRLDVPLGPHGQVQPAAAHRGELGAGALRGPRGVSGQAVTSLLLS